MVLESVFRGQIDKYLAGDLSFEEFEDWFVLETRIQYLSNTPEVIKLASDIRYLMFQHIESEITEDDFRNSLRRLNNV